MISLLEEIKIATLFFIIFGYITFFYIQNKINPELLHKDIFINYLKLTNTFN